MALLGQLGLTAIGLEKDLEAWPTARAVHFDGEIFRVLQTLGVAEELTAATLPMSSTHFQNETGEVLISVPTGEFGPQAWPNNITFHQPEVERLIRQRISELPNIELRRGVTAGEVRNISGGVEVNIVDSNGQEAVLRAKWLIAADGARSPIRRALEIESEKFGEDAEWVVVDGHLVDSPGYEDDMVFLCHHTRPALWIRLPGTRVRMEFMVMEGDDLDEIVTPAAIERISRGILPAAQFHPDRQAVYTFRGRIAQRWREGRIFLAGDSAHQAPPCFGQGLCAGIRDVANLTWKLGLIKRGVADESLLDTYETERKPHAQFWVEQATNAAMFLQTTDAEAARKRDEYLWANPMEAAPVSPPIGPGLRDANEGDIAGYLSIQPMLADGKRLDELVGLRFLIAANAELYNQLSSEVRQQIEFSDHIVVMNEPEKINQLLEFSGSSAVVVRPDRYVLGVGQSAGDLELLVQYIPGISVPTPQSV
ncbi:MAG TPA: bifunctional 3-(3-hydroxy-phenyl)propionate/3-hydroxycinnamic acid hydroxylase [Enteractinococcus helveticum]|uniref:Bifunctional 3-(3-hydroxy-phenyl)propionate/3-hydroxycinnamic acid hydroxylase n=1 Tax=Enteractinococcus helveticum TaxID=1837282 RepID=A0A921K7E6_9MICC|nr:bifunctional 3-(3-hydroxy-phenyl)propionate/3-hydroxycinnamic acid hydroxylase [Enteractinococcus helveticum]